MVGSVWMRRSAWWAWLGFVGCSPDASDPSHPDRNACIALPRPQLDEAIALEPVFTDVAVEGGVALAHLPGDGSRWYVAAKSGVVYTFGDGAPQVFADLQDRVVEDGEAGLLGIAFHPRFADNGEVYLAYTAPGADPFRSVIARFTSPDGGRTLDVDSAAEVLSIDQPFTNHNGGDLRFGPDGFLYIGFGDGGSASDPYGNGQDLDTWLGKMLRIDVDGGDPYAIPADNPFAAGGGAPEIFAWGLRNPWRFSFDRATGDLWVGDVGQNLWEEVDLVVKGGNYGWNLEEGSECFGRETCPVDTIDPVAQYRNRGGASVVGGAVYRGSELPDLVGAFVYSDFYRGTVWSVRNGEEPRVLHRSGGRRIAAWAEDEAGELYGVSYDGGIVRIVPAPPPDGADRFPRTLSASGCVQPSDPTAPAAELVAYDVALPFWSDGADKSRFVAVPPGERIDVGADGRFVLPVGSVVVKAFARADQTVETRLLVRHDDGAWAGYSYAWREDGSDADLVVDGLVAPVDDGAWVYPAIEDCAWCHGEAAGGTLGLRTEQLTDDALDRFVEHGLLDARPEGDPLPGDTASLEDRARAYLHVNCAQCHHPDGAAGRARIDLRIETPLAETGLCDRPRAGDVNRTDAWILAPGDPDRSVLLARVESLGSVRMPPVGSLVVDTAGAELLRSWITARTSP